MVWRRRKYGVLSQKPSSENGQFRVVVLRLAWITLHTPCLCAMLARVLPLYFPCRCILTRFSIIMQDKARLRESSDVVDCAGQGWRRGSDRGGGEGGARVYHRGLRLGSYVCVKRKSLHTKPIGPERKPGIHVHGLLMYCTYTRLLQHAEPLVQVTRTTDRTQATNRPDALDEALRRHACPTR